MHNRPKSVITGHKQLHFVTSDILDARALFLVQSWSQSPTFDSDSTPLHATTQHCNLTVDKHVNYTH